MAMAARKQQTAPTTPTNGEVIQMMPRMSKRLQSLIQSGSSKVSSDSLRTSMMSLHASLPAGAFSLCQSIIRRSGRGWGIPTYCIFCDAVPPDHMHRTDLRRRWQALHYAMHIKRGDTPDNFEVHEGDVGGRK